MKSVKNKLIRFTTKLSLALLLVPALTQGGTALAVSTVDSTETSETSRDFQTGSSDLKANSTIASSEEGIAPSDTSLQGEFGSSHWEITADHELLIFGGDFSPTEGKSPWIDYKDQIEKISIVEPVHAALESSDLFAGLTSLTEIQRIENIQFTEPTKINRLFAGDEALQKIDVKKWDTTKVIENDELFSGAGLLEIHLGVNSVFQSMKETNPQETSKVWQDTASDESYPTLELLLSAYKGNKEQIFQYVEPKIVQGKIRIQFVDETGQKIREDQEISGTVGEAYDLTAANVLPEIDGFTLNEAQSLESMNGYYGEQPQTITLYYQKIAVAKDSSDQNEKQEKDTLPVGNPVLSYSTHVESKGWQSYVKDGASSGTTGLAKRLEAIKIKAENTDVAGAIQYRTHIQSIGWESSFRQNDAVSGTTGQAKRLEAIQIKLTGELAQKYDVYYRVHAQKFGWLGWAKNGESAGTTGMAYRLEAIQIELVNKGEAAPGSTSGAFHSKPDISYQTHLQSIGWQGYQSNGGTSGTTGQAKRLEAIQIKVDNQTLGGSVQYRTHIQSTGWESSFKQNNAISGTTGQAKRLEAIQIQLTGDLNKYFDVYYRVHAQKFGWLGWAKNGASAGTEGYAYRLEGIQIKIQPKGTSAPGSTANAFHKKEKTTEIILGNVPYVSQYTPVFAPWGCAGAAMAMLLRSKNVSVDLRYVQDNLPMYPQPGGQKGNVYTGEGFGWVITPATLTAYMRRWYANVRNISGSDTNTIINTVLSGKPVLYYGYSSYQKVGDNVRNHCKVIAGYKDGKFLVYDPLYYSPDAGPGTGGGNMNYDLGAKHWLPVSKFNNEYNRQAIVID